MYKNSVSTEIWVDSKQFTVETTTDSIFTFDSGGKYIFSRVKVKFASKMGAITALSGLEFLLHYSATDLDLNSGTLTYNGTPSTKSFTIPTLNLDTVITEYTLFCLPFIHNRQLLKNRKYYSVWNNKDEFGIQLRH